MSPAMITPMAMSFITCLRLTVVAGAQHRAQPDASRAFTESTPHAIVWVSSAGRPWARPKKGCRSAANGSMATNIRQDRGNHSPRLNRDISSGSFVRNRNLNLRRSRSIDARSWPCRCGERRTVMTSSSRHWWQIRLRRHAPHRQEHSVHVRHHRPARLEIHQHGRSVTRWLR
jgi:hypothetical protein